MEHKLEKTRKFLMAVFVVGLIIIGISVVKNLIRYGMDGLLDSNTAQSVDSGWYLMTEGGREEVTLPASIDLADGTDSLTLYREFTPEELKKGLLMVYSSRQKTEVSCGGQIVLAAEGWDEAKTSVNEYNLASLPESEESQTVAVTFSACRNGVCTAESILVCTVSEAFIYLISKDVFNLVALVLCILLAAVTGMFCCYLLYKKRMNPQFICLFFLAVDMALWIASGMWTATFLPFSNEIVCQLHYTSLMILGIPIGLFAYHSTINHKSGPLLAFIGISIVNMMLQQVLYLARVFGFYDMLPLAHGLLAATALVAMLALIHDYQMKKSTIGLMLAFTFVVPLSVLLCTLFLFWSLGGSLYTVISVLSMASFVLLLIVDAIYTVLENSYQQRKTQIELELFQDLSVNDRLTGLGNRRAFDDYMEEVEKQTFDDVVLFFLDVNGLKTVNDTYGHNAGDELIKRAADCIRKCFAEGKSYRLGGDEFASVVENPQISDESYFSRLRRCVEEFNDGRAVELSIAKGSSHLYDRDHIKRSISLWKSNADREMYADKMRTKILIDQSENHGIVSENIDDLTGILTLEGFRKNALYLICQNPEEPYALWYFDIKKFRFINDFFGYEMGDKLIQYFSKVILENIREDETCGRMSGTSIVVLTRMKRGKELERYFRYVTSHVSGFFMDSNMTYMTYRVEIAAGVYLLKPEDKKCPNVNQMLDWANVAQKSVKNLNGNRFSIFGEKMWEQQWRELYINQTLDDALKNGDLSVWLQPQYNYATGRISGAEALCRWKHDSLGWLSPGEFIPALERTGQVYKLDYYVWKEACRLMERWRNSNTILSVSLSVNLSRIDVMEGNIIEKLDDLTKQHALPPEVLRLEITESGYMDRPEMLVEFVNLLHEHGYTVEMDDFGSGFSSLNMLKDVPVDIIKIDMRFLKGNTKGDKGEKIIRAVVGMAKELGIPVLMEGVEKEEQAKYLSSIGCILMQGYYFSKPLPVEEFEELLREEKRIVDDLEADGLERREKPADGAKEKGEAD